MTILASAATAIGSFWDRLVTRGKTGDFPDNLGPNLRKELATAPDGSASTCFASHGGLRHKP